MVRWDQPSNPQTATAALLVNSLLAPGSSRPHARSSAPPAPDLTHSPTFADSLTSARVEPTRPVGQSGPSKARESRPRSAQSAEAGLIAPPDAAALATQQLCERGPARATVQDATARAAQPSADQDQHEYDSADTVAEDAPSDSPSDQCPDLRPQQGASRSQGQAATAVLSNDDADFDPSASAPQPTAFTTCAQPADSSGHPSSSDSIDPSSSGNSTVFPLNSAVPSSSADTSAALAAATASIPSASAAAETPAESAEHALAPISAIKPSDAATKPTPSRLPTPQTPPEASTAPGVRGQAMRGVFALLRPGQSGSGSALLRLEPEGLGQLKVNLSVSEGKVSAVFAVSTDEARASMQDSLESLHHALESRGLIVHSIDVVLDKSLAHDPSAQDFTPPGQDWTQLAGDSRNSTGGGGPFGDRSASREHQDGEVADGAAPGLPASYQPGVETPSVSQTRTWSAAGWRLGVDLTV